MRILLISIIIRLSQQQLNSLELFPSTNTIQATTTYQLKFLLSQIMPSGSTIKIDFSSTTIITPNTLTKCTGSVYFTSITTDYTNCQCSNSVCSIPITQAVSSSALYLLEFGQLTNPTYVKDQVISLSVNFTTTVYTQQYTVDVYSAGSLTLNSQSQSSYKVYALNQIVLSLQSQHSIEQNGKLIIQFPTQIIFSSSSVIVQISSTNYTGTTATSGQQLYVSNVFTSAITAGSSFIIYLLNVQNQDSIKTSDQILIQTATQDSYLIDSIGFYIITNIPESITISYLNALNTQIVNSNTTFQFSLQPSLKFTNGGYLSIQFPTELTINSDMTCTKIIGLTLVSGTTYSCSISSQIIRTTNLQYPNVNNSLILTISSIKNPSSTKPTGTFIFKTYDVDGNLMCVSSSSSATYTASADTLTGNITRTISTVTLQSQYNVAFTNKNAIPSNGQFIFNIGTQALKYTTQSLSCNDQQNNAITCFYSNDSTINITLSSSCAANTFHNISLSYLTNPNYVITTTSDFIISTTDSYGYIIDELNAVTITPQLTPIDMLSIIYYRGQTIGQSQSSLNVGSLTNIELQFSISSQYIIQNDGNAILDLNGYYYLDPDDTFYCQQILASSIISKNCQIVSYVTQDSPTMNLLKQILIPNIIQNSNATIDVTINGIRTQLEVGTTTHQINVYIYTLNNQLVSQGYNTLGNTQIINLQNTISNGLTINSSSQITGQLCQYTIKHNLLYPLDISSRNGYLTLTFPSDVNTDSISNCLITLNSNTLQCSQNTNIVKITSTINPFQINQQIIIIINQIRNPYSTKTTNNFLLQYYYNNAVFAQISNTYSVTVPNNINVNSIRSPTKLNSDAQLTFNFNLSNQADSLNYILILPTDQIISTQLNIQSSNGTILAVQSDTSDSTMLKLQFQELLCPCQIGSELSFTLSGFKNPLLSSSSNGQIFLVDNSNNVYQENQTISLPGITQGSITILNISQTANSLNSDTQIYINASFDTPKTLLTLVIIFNVNYVPFINNNLILFINSNQVTYVIDQSKYSITCSSVTLLAQNNITLSSIKTIKWLTTNPQCQITISTYSGTIPIDSISNFDCNALTSLPIKTFDSTIIRNNRILNQNTNVTISFNNEINGYVRIKLPLSELQNDLLFSFASQYVNSPIITNDSNYLNIVLTVNSTSSSDINITLNNLQNANSLISTQTYAIIELTIDLITISYKSQTLISPTLICQGSQCSTQQLSLLSFIKSSTLISQLTNIQLNIQLPVQLQNVTSLILSFSETTLLTSTLCYINNSLTNCNDLATNQCTLCEQTQINIIIKNAQNADLFNSLEKVCVSLETESEEINVCQTFTMSYNYLLEIQSTQWINYYYYQQAILSVSFQLASQLSSQYANYIYFTNTNNQVNFNNNKIQICSNGCQSQQIQSINITNITFDELYIYDSSQTMQFGIMCQDQNLEISSNIALFPKTLLMNSLTFSAQALNYVELNYNISSDVYYNQQSLIRIKLLNNCAIQNNIGTQINSTCSLKDNSILQVSLIYNGQITHQSNQIIALEIENSNCPTDYYNYNDNCYITCPSTTYKNGQNCYSCIINNCQTCTETECTQCSSGYQLLNNVCQIQCNISYCDICYDSQTCSSCSQNYVLYQNQCKQINDCTIDNCELCQISNQSLKCLECSTDKYQLNYTCLDECPNNYFNNNSICYACPQGCSQCTSTTQCQECLTNYVLNNELCKCNIDGCLYCQNSQCDECESGLIKYNDTCLSQCPPGYYLNQTTCVICNVICETCNSGGCLTCPNDYFLENNECVKLNCLSNCQQCSNNSSCDICDQGYEGINCEQILKTPYIGPAFYTYIGIFSVILIYGIISILLPPKLPIIPQIILTSIVITSIIQTIGNLILLIITFIETIKIDFILCALMFSITNVYHLQQSLIQNNPILVLLTGGTWIRTPLLKLKYISKKNTQYLSNYSLLRQTSQYDQFITNTISLIICIILIVLQSPNETPYLAIIKLFIDILKLSAFALELRLI